MKTTIDAAGRVVVPKAIRERLRLLGGGEVDIAERDGVIEIVPVAAAVEIVDGPGGAVAAPVDDLPPLTDEQVLAAIDATRR
jgi:AbrB family looped-hinge helix DNA binding protein